MSRLHLDRDTFLAGLAAGGWVGLTITTDHLLLGLLAVAPLAHLLGLRLAHRHRPESDAPTVVYRFADELDVLLREAP